MRKSLSIATCLLVSFAVVASFSCRRASRALGKKIAEKTIEGTSGGKAKIDLGVAGNIDVSGLPEALRYPGAKAVRPFSSYDASSQRAAYVFETADPVASVTAFYAKALAGWKSKGPIQTGPGETLVSYSSSDGKQTVDISLGTTAKKTTVFSILYGTKQ